MPSQEHRMQAGSRARRQSERQRHKCANPFRVFELDPAARQLRKNGVRTNVLGVHLKPEVPGHFHLTQRSFLVRNLRR